MTLTILSEDFRGLYQEVQRRQEDNLALGHGRTKCNPQVYCTSELLAVHQLRSYKSTITQSVPEGTQFPHVIFTSSITISIPMLKHII